YVMIGGMRNDFELVPDCVAFEWSAQRFEPFPCPAAARLSGDLISLEGGLVLLGGSSVVDGELSANRSVEVLEGDAEQWRALMELPFETRHMRALGYGRQILLVSTH